MNEIFFQTNSFEQQFVLINILFSQVEIAVQCSSIDMNDEDFSSQCLSNAKNLYSETLSPKNHEQVRFDNKGYHGEVLVLFGATLPKITTDTHTG